MFNPPTVTTSEPTPHDLVSDAVRAAKLGPHVADALVMWLVRGLEDDRHAKLDGAPVDPSTRARLARVFTDVGLENDGTPEEREERPGVLARLLSNELVPRRWSHDRRGAARRAEVELPRFVLVGGPGQGKSTLAQQLTQQHRAAWLSPRKEGLDDIARVTLDDIAARAAEDSLAMGDVVRLPFLVPLGTLSRWRVTRSIAEPLLLNFLVEQVNDAGGSVSAEELTALLRATPWLLVLDGLDEVPASAGRRETLGLAERFMRELAGSKGMLVGTTRPQGYQGDFGEVDELHLAAFSTKRALAYAKRLLEDWFPSAVSEQRRLLERLTTASADANTAQLLGTPLHVSILTALLHRTPVVPRERWQMFHDFFASIYQREVDRPHPYAELLKRWRRYIEPMHHVAGLHLQALGERAEGAVALLTKPELVRIVDAQLQIGKFTEERRRELVHDIVEAASDRLVLLAQVRDGRYGFTLRSIQEFMAAEALTGGAHEAVVRRARRLVPLPYWRNVVLLMVSKVFSPGQSALAPLTEALTIGLCDRLTERDEATVYVPGDDAAFASDLLGEGSVTVDPGVTRAVLERALTIIDQPDAERAKQLVTALSQVVGDEDCARELDAIARPLRAARLGNSDDLGAWRFAIGLADAGIAWANALATKRWPVDAEARRFVALHCSGSPWALSKWVEEKVIEDLDTFGPNEMMKIEPLFGWPKAPRLWVSCEPQLTSLRRITVSPEDAPIAFQLRPLDSAGVPAVVLAELARLTRWQPWSWIARFSSAPSPEVLSEALAYFANEASPEQVERARAVAPWPIAACLAWAESPEELRTLSEAAARGELGDLGVWRAAESRWAAHPTTLRESAPDGGALPFSVSIRDHGFVPCGEARIAWDQSAIEDPDVVADQTTRVVLEVLQTSRRRAVARWAALVLDVLVEDAWPVRSVVPLSLMERLLDASHADIGMLTRIVALAERDALVELLEARRDRVAVSDWTQPDPISSLLEAHPAAPVLLLLALRMVSWDGHLRVRIPAATFVMAESLAPEDRAAVAAFEFARGGALDIARLASLLVVSDLAVEAALAIAFDDSARGASLAIELLARLPDSKSDLRARCTRLLLQARKLQCSELLVPSEWKELSLPRPSPPEPSSASPVAPVHIESLRIENVRAFDAFELPVASSGDNGAWVVLLGENGTGKSTALRAITLALAEPDYATTMFTESASRATWRRDPEKPARATVSLHGQSYTVTLGTGDTGRETLVASSDPPNGSARERPFLVAYGCRRGAADGGRDQKVDVEPLDGIGTLFDAPGRALVIAEAWLKDLALAQLQNEPGSAHLYDVVREVLVGDGTTEGILPGVRAMRISGGTVWFEGPDVGTSPLAALSDGYITTAGWVIDLMARWIHHRRTRKELVSRDFTSEMRGVVLLDEIDLHLHPRWQRELIPAVRRVFPKLTFVVTTHNPLTVIGAREGEVFVLRRRKGASGVEARRLHLPVGMRADQVLTGEWFGLATTLDPETFDLWERHYRALRSGKKAGDPELRDLERELARRLGTYASTSLDRIALDVAAEVMGDRPKDLSASEREAARASILEWVKHRAEDAS